MIRLAYNVTSPAQSLRHIPSTRQASLSWILEDAREEIGDGDRTLDSGGPVAVDTTTEVTTAAAGRGQANPSLMTVASTTGFVVGGTYEIVGTNGVEVFEVAVVTTNTSIAATLPLIGSYPLGSTIQGRMHTTATVSASVIQDADRVANDWPMRVVWIYADGTRHQEQVRLVHDPEADLFVVPIVADIRAVFPDVDTRMQYHNRDVLTPHVRAVIRQIRADALGMGIHQERWLTGDQGHWLAVYRTLVHLANLGDFPGNVEVTDWIAYCKGEYDKRWNALVMGYGKAEVLEQNRQGVAAASDGTSYRPVDWRNV